MTRALRRLLRWMGWSLGVGSLMLLVAMVVTIRFGDASLYPAPAAGPRIEVLVVNHGYHAGIVVPRDELEEIAGRNRLPALAAVAARFAGYRQIEIGWGDAGFYTQVPDTGALSVGMGLRALFMPGNPSVLHVVGLAIDPRTAFARAEVVALALSKPGFERLTGRLDAAFAPTGRDGTIEELGRGLYGPSLFYRAVGHFHLLRVCNHWIADLLDAAGVPTAPVLATLPQGLLWDLSWRAGAQRLPPPRKMPAS